jgi:predicted small secreted protein
MTGMLKRSAVFLVCVMSVLAAGCHTTRGFGQDVQGAGRGIENATK